MIVLDIHQNGSSSQMREGGREKFWALSGWGGAEWGRGLGAGQMWRGGEAGLCGAVRRGAVQGVTELAGRGHAGQRRAECRRAGRGARQGEVGLGGAGRPQERYGAVSGGLGGRDMREREREFAAFNAFRAESHTQQTLHCLTDAETLWTLIKITSLS